MAKWDEEHFYDQRESFYDSEDQYMEEVVGKRKGDKKRDKANYIPSPEEIKQRIDDLNWLKRHDFPLRFICAVMQFDSPGIDLVKRKTKQLGSWEAYQLLKSWMPDESELNPWM